jgi:hypothetical protein
MKQQFSLGHILLAFVYAAKQQAVFLYLLSQKWVLPVGT